MCKQMWVSYFFLYIYIYLFVFVVVCVGGTKCNAPVNVNPVGGGVRAMGGDLTAKSIPQ